MPPRRRNNAADSASRFLALRQRPAPRRPAVQHDQASPIEVRPVPEEWRFVEGKFPGAYAAWCAEPDAPSVDFVRGVTGRPYYAVAIGRGLSNASHSERRYFWFVGGRWELRQAPRAALTSERP